MAKWCDKCNHYCPDTPRHVDCEQHTNEAVDDVVAAKRVWDKWSGVPVTEENTTKLLTEIVNVVKPPRNSDRECRCEVTEHVADCPSWGL
jgi:hypothetical protein